jgi:exopolysaccharide biosynthesis protein
MMFLPGVVLAASALWQVVQPGLWVHEAQMSDQGALAPVEVIAVRLDPQLVEFALDTSARGQARGAWTIDRLPPTGVLAVNAGQFAGDTPWGWLVLEGVETQPPGAGSTAMAFVVSQDGAVALLDPGEIPAARRTARYAFQSYPALILGGGKVPWELQSPGRGVDLAHRDSRLALGVLPDHTVVVAITRFSGLGAAGATLPWGPTVVEMADFMRSLGCVRAVLLDGGISSQLALRATDGSLRRWTNWRTVPLGLIVRLRVRPPSAPVPAQ